jgi:hypothetical protein
MGWGKGFIGTFLISPFYKDPPPPGRGEDHMLQGDCYQNFL